MLGILLGAWSENGRAQTPEDRYLKAYATMQQADDLRTGGDSRGAINRYLEAQVALKEIRQQYPGWNERILAFRLEYISDQLAPLTKGGMPPAEAAPSDGPKVSPLEQQQGEIARLAGQNALLEARLREALKVQPAATDPRELARAEERIKALQKERDLLAVTLEQAKVNLPRGASADVQAAAVQQQVVTQSAVADVLKKQNDELQRQITELQKRLQGRLVAGITADTLPLKEAIAALQASNRVMKVEQEAMENRLLEFVKTYNLGASEREKEFEKKLAEANAVADSARKERDTLLQKLEMVTRELNKEADKQPTAASAELERQLESIRAKLEIFEAKAVPYSSEELALFKQAPIKVAAAQAAVPPPTNAPAVTGTNGPAVTAAAANGTNAPAVAARKKELPPGAGPLLRDADRAIDAERFDEAEAKLRDILRQDPDQPFVLAKLAAVQMDQNKTAEAEASLQKALTVDPQDSACLYLMGSLKVRQEKFDEGIDLLSQTVKLSPENAQAHYYLAKALVQKGQRKPAETALRKAIHIKPGWGEAHYLLAVIYATQEPNFRGLAQYHYKRAIAGGAPRNPDLEKFMEKDPPPAK
jgi:cytochrome c-type biogenesis protein CcmH/NrfG